MQTQTGRSRGRGGERASESAPVLWVEQAQDLDGGSLGTMAQVLVACKALAVADERKLDREGDGGGRLGAERAQETERERECVVGEGGGVLGHFGEALERAGDEERSEGARSEAVLLALVDDTAARLLLSALRCSLPPHLQQPCPDPVGISHRIGRPELSLSHRDPVAPRRHGRERLCSLAAQLGAAHRHARRRDRR